MSLVTLETTISAVGEGGSRTEESKALTAAIRAEGVGMAVGRMETARLQTQQKGT